MRPWLFVPILLLAGCDMNIRRGDLAEQPPEGWEELGRHPAYGELRLATREEVDAYCRARGGDAEAFNKRRIHACVDHEGKMVILPAEGLQDPKAAAETKKHEYLHTWGPIHPGGNRRFEWPDGSPVKPITDAQAQVIRSMAEAQVRNALQAPTGRNALQAPLASAGTNALHSRR